MDTLSSSYSSFSIYTLVTIFAIAWYSILILRWRRPSVRLPPGPTGLPIVGRLPFLPFELHTHFAQLAQTYGPIFRMKLGSKLAIVISSPALAREALRDNDAIMANHDVPAAGHVLTYGSSDMVWNPQGPTWRILRRVCVQEMMTSASLDAMYSLRRQEVRATVHGLWKRGGTPVEIGAEMSLALLDLLTNMIWGDKTEGEGAEQSKVNKEFRELAREAVDLLGQPNSTDFFPYLAWFDLQGIRRRSTEIRELLDKIFDPIIDRRRKGKGEKKDLLEQMLRMEAEGGDGKTPITINHVKGLMMDIIVGGSDSTSTTIEWAMAQLMQNPEIMKRVQEELDQVVGEDDIVEESHLPKLHYLGAVLKEVLRLHPAVPLLVPHRPSSNCMIGGYTVPQGSRVFFNVWSIHRDPSIWEEPLEFRPERFLETNNKRDFSGSDFSYFPFGSGRRICAGIPMADRMAKYLLASLMHSFDWKLQDGEKLDLSEKFGIVLKKAKPLVAIPIPRLPNPEKYS